MPLTPEQLAREEIDEQLEACGWVIQDFTSMNIHAGRGVAVREYPLKWTEGGKTRPGSADYLLYADGRAIGVGRSEADRTHPRGSGRSVEALHRGARQVGTGLGPPPSVRLRAIANRGT